VKSKRRVKITAYGRKRLQVLPGGAPADEEKKTMGFGGSNNVGGGVVVVTTSEQEGPSPQKKGRRNTIKTNRLAMN